MSTRPNNSEAAYIWDALTEARNVGLFVADVAVSSGTSVTCFSKSATERQLEIVGEALRNLRRIAKATAKWMQCGYKNHVEYSVISRFMEYEQQSSLTAWRAATTDVWPSMAALSRVCSGGATGKIECRRFQHRREAVRILGSHTRTELLFRYARSIAKAGLLRKLRHGRRRQADTARGTFRWCAWRHQIWSASPRTGSIRRLPRRWRSTRTGAWPGICRRGRLFRRRFWSFPRSQ